MAKKQEVAFAGLVGPRFGGFARAVKTLAPFHLFLLVGCQNQADDTQPALARWASSDTVEIGVPSALSLSEFETVGAPRESEVSFVTAVAMDPSGELLAVAGKNASGRTLVEIIEVGAENFGEMLDRIGWADRPPPHWVGFLGCDSIVSFSPEEGTLVVSDIGPLALSATSLSRQYREGSVRFSGVPVFLDAEGLVFLGSPFIPADAKPGLVWSQRFLLRQGFEADGLDTLALVDDQQVFWGPESSLDLVFPPGLHLVGTAAVVGIGRSDTPSVTLFYDHIAGNALRTLVWDATPVKMTRTHLDEWLDWKRLLQRELGTPIPSHVRGHTTVPFFGGIVGGMDGSVWVRTGPWPQTAFQSGFQGGADWLGIRKSGETLRARFPDGTMIAGVRPDGALVSLHRGPDGIAINLWSVNNDP